MAAAGQSPDRSPPESDGDGGRQTLIAFSLDPQLIFLFASIALLCIILCSRNAFFGCPWRAQRRRRSTAADAAASAARSDLESPSTFDAAYRRGLSEEMIKALPVSRFSEAIAAAGNVECAVCLAEFEGGDELRTLPLCGHAFHAECIDRWLRSQATCPLCRAAVLRFSPLFSGRIRQFPAEVLFIDAAWRMPQGQEPPT